MFPIFIHTTFFWAEYSACQAPANPGRPKNRPTKKREKSCGQSFLEPEFDEDYDFCTHRSSKARHYFDFFRLRYRFYYKYEEATSAFTSTTSKSSRCFTYLQHTYSTELCAKISKSIPLIVAHMLKKRSFVLKRCVLLSKIALFEYLFDSVR